MTVLVTGGAGYVGAHAVQELSSNGTACVVLDSLERGHRETVPPGVELVVGDVGDAGLLDTLFARLPIDAVMHFAAYADVAESVRDPGRYYRNNVAATVTLLRAMVRHGVGALIFSSSCATYGTPERIPLTEDHPQRPINPYGAAKLMVERMLRDFDAAHGLRSVVFRYFNAAGADPHGRIGEWHEPETHLIPLALAAAAGGPRLSIFGTDYATPDGTCVRDYIHVSDLARAHVLGLDYLGAGRPSEAFNLGNGSGFSVRSVIRTVEEITGRSVPVQIAPRRAGDPSILVGSAERARSALGWSPRHEALEAIVETAWRWYLRRAPGRA